MLGFVGSAKDEALPGGFPLLVAPTPRVLPLLFIKSPPQLRSPVWPVELGPGQDPTSVLRPQPRLWDS